MAPIGPVTPGEASSWNPQRPRPQSTPLPASRRERKGEASLDEPLVLWHVTMDEWTPAWHHEGPWPARVQIAMYRESGGEELDAEVEIRHVDFRA